MTSTRWLVFTLILWVVCIQAPSAPALPRPEPPPSFQAVATCVDTAADPPVTIEHAQRIVSCLQPSPPMRKAGGKGVLSLACPWQPRPNVISRVVLCQTQPSLLLARRGGSPSSPRAPPSLL